MNQPQVLIGGARARQVTFIGPFGVGKTTALRRISDIPVVDADVASLEAVGPDAAAGADKRSTTTAFDYGEWHFDDGPAVQLIGLPGQGRFEAIWDLMLPRSTGVVLWLFGDRQDAPAECRAWLEILARRHAVARLAVAVTRVPPGQEALVMARLRQVVAGFHPWAPLMCADPRLDCDVLQAVTMALLTPKASLCL